MNNSKNTVIGYFYINSEDPRPPAFVIPVGAIKFHKEYQFSSYNIKNDEGRRKCLRLKARSYTFLHV